MKIDKVKLNFLKTYHLFYDWTETDEIKEYHNIILVRVKSDVIRDLINYQIKLLDADLKNNEILLFTDTYSYVAIKFNAEKISIFKSSLLISDEESLEKYEDDLQLVALNYEKLKVELPSLSLRGDEAIKEKLLDEINKLKEEKNNDKLQYFYYAWFHKKATNEEKMYAKMYAQLKEPISLKETNMYTLIKNNYKTV